MTLPQESSRSQENAVAQWCTIHVAVVFGDVLRNQAERPVFCEEKPWKIMSFLQRNYNYNITMNKLLAWAYISYNIYIYSLHHVSLVLLINPSLFSAIPGPGAHTPIPSTPAHHPQFWFRIFFVVYYVLIDFNGVYLYLTCLVFSTGINGRKFV